MTISFVCLILWYESEFRIPPRRTALFWVITQWVLVQFLFHWIAEGHLKDILTIILLFVGWDNDSLRAGLAGDRIPMGGEIFLTRPDRSWCSPSRLYVVCFLEVKRPEHLFGHPPPSSAEVRERLELHLHSPSRPAWPVVGRTKNISCFLRLDTNKNC